MKIDNIDLTQQFNLSIFSDFRYQSIKITWLLPISIDWLIRALHHEFSNQNFNLIFGNSTLQEAIKYKKKKHFKKQIWRKKHEEYPPKTKCATKGI